METFYEFIWYLVICASVMFFIVLDGFDLGVGILHMFAKDDYEHRIFLNAIGPVWDGNEVWLVIIAGATFAGFPLAYATLCTAFYTPIMILLCGLIFRASAIEFRSKIESRSWRKVWDWVFCVSSHVIAFIVGVLLGNLIQGIPIDARGHFIGTFWGFFTPYTVLVGIMGISLFAMHGAIYLLMKTEGELHSRLRFWVYRCIAVFVILYFLATMATLIHMPHMVALFRHHEWLFIFGALTVFFIANIIRQVHRGNDWLGFLSSCMAMVFLFILYGLGTYPNLVRSSIDPEQYSITIWAASSSTTTLMICLLIAIIGVPLVIAYGYWIYRIFRGKVSLQDASY